MRRSLSRPRPCTTTTWRCSKPAPWKRSRNTRAPCPSVSFRAPRLTKWQAGFGMLNRVLDAYEPAANRIANTVGVSFVQERERIIRQQQEAIRELSTPVLQVRERLLILPIIGVIDPQRARQLTEQLL